MTIVTVDKSGRVLIPKALRDALGLKAGSVLIVEEGENELRLKPIENEEWLQEKEGVLVFCGRATGEIVDAVHRHREERLDSSAEMSGQ